MTIQVIKDTIESTISSSADGVELVRYIKLLGYTSGSAEQKLYNVLKHSSIPKVGEFHAKIPFIRVTDVSVNPIDAGSFMVAVTYGTYSFEKEAPSETSKGTKQIGSSTHQVTHQKNNQGKQLKVSLNIRDKKTGKTERKEQIVEVDMEFPTTVIQWSRREPKHPIAKSRFYTGSVNRISVWGFKPRTMLCLRIEGISDDGGKTYDVNYEFQYNAPTWDVQLVYIDAEKDKPHEQVDTPSGNGLGIERIYPETDFRNLNLAL